MKPEIPADGVEWPTSQPVRARERRHAPDAVRAPASMRKERRGNPRPPAERHAAIRVSRRFRATPESVFHAWLDPDVAGNWLFATASRPMVRVDIDARVGGVFRLTEDRDGAVIAHQGKYLEIVPHRRLRFTLSTHDHPHAATRVTMEVERRKGGCALTLTHEYVRPDRARATRQRWTGMLYGLGETLDPVQSP